ncbi:MAG: hypothetical protein CVV53_00800 [Spirochaetae bacterium HGW-Spirochaetae-9]|nr:MAG: hypothetical protein CVV53_00800 [Spirochaetae bacterium HGW-Spirochaetae-9]
MDASVEAFWAGFEKETGEKALCRTMGQYFPSPKDRSDWGLLVLSPSGLRFRKTPSENWFASIFKASSSAVPSRSEDDLVIPYSSINRISLPPKKFLDFLFGTPFCAFTVSYQHDGKEKEARFAADPKSDILARLHASIQAQ